MFRDRDPALGRFERDATCVWATLIAAAAAAGGGRIDMPLGVVGGGALAALSYLAIKGGATALVDAVAASAAAGPQQPPACTGLAGDAGSDPSCVEHPPLPDGHRARAPQVERRQRRRRTLIIVLKFLGRCALLALVAYGMLSRLRLHPLGLLAGVSAPVLAAPLQLVYRPDASRPGKSG